MKIDATRRSAPARGGRAAASRRGGFKPAEPHADAALVPVGGARAAGSVASVDALMALQATGDPLEARAQSTARAHDMLDAMDEMRLGLLEGRADGGAVARLSGASARLRAATGDSGLESVLDAVEVRAAVELAKYEAASRHSRA